MPASFPLEPVVNLGVRTHTGAVYVPQCRRCGREHWHGGFGLTTPHCVGFRPGDLPDDMIVELPLRARR